MGEPSLFKTPEVRCLSLLSLQKDEAFVFSLGAKGVYKKSVLVNVVIAIMYVVLKFNLVRWL